MTDQALTRYRITFHKTGDLRYTGHLDLHRSMERTLRRAKLPLDYSKGYNPRVKLNLSTALPLGCTSTTELADFWLVNHVDKDEVLQAVRAAAPPGLSFVSVEMVDLKTASLQSQIEAVSYHVELPALIDQTALESKVTALMQAETRTRSRRGKSYDLRALIKSLEVAQSESTAPAIQMILKAGEGSTGRPEEVLQELDVDPATALIERTQLYLSA